MSGFLSIFLVLSDSKRLGMYANIAMDTQNQSNHNFVPHCIWKLLKIHL